MADGQDCPSYIPKFLTELRALIKLKFRALSFSFRIPPGELMSARVSIATLILLSLAVPASAQVVRFETTMGDFDMVLNPTNNTQLQGHVDNMIAYVNGKRYDGSWINRADTGFVLQMGGFYSHTKRPPITVASTRSVQAFAPIQGSPGISGLSNTAGTISLALPSGNINGGTSSFFVNVGNNTGLDSQFTVFGAIPDMSVVNQIMALTKLDRTTDPLFGVSDPNNLAFTDVPLQTNGQQVLIKRAFVISDAMTIAQATFAAQSVMAQSAAAVGAGGGTSSLQSAALGVPEPTGTAMLLIGQLFLLGCRRRRSR
jgi:peptidyl-prolyl cis-trans isomerase A (cyclophilin A)